MLPADGYCLIVPYEVEAVESSKVQSRCLPVRLASSGGLQAISRCGCFSVLSDFVTSWLKIALEWVRSGWTYHKQPGIFTEKAVWGSDFGPH